MNFILAFLLASGAYASPQLQKLLRQAPAGAPAAIAKNGTYYGTYSPSYNQDFFLGIPFSYPPLWNLRFRNPVSMDHRWEGALPATSYAPECIGYGGDQIGYEQSEDCLYLNVIRPHGYDYADLPVAVWIHAGGLFMGGTADKRYNLSFIVENSVKIGKPIIAVSIAYRLGAFGFLYSEEVQDSGQTNIGFRDQRLALHWIKENIAGFGGDPTKITIWGESSGAVCVGLHLLAYDGRDDNLFRAGIMQSGNPLSYSASFGVEYYQPRFDALLNATNCETNDPLNCLRSIPFSTLNSILNTTEFTYGWVPEIDGDIFRRLTSEQLISEQFVHVPIISGANTDEGTVFASQDIETTEQFKNEISSVTPAGLSNDLAGKFLDAYPADLSNGIPSSQELGGNFSFNDTFGAMWRRAAAFYGDQIVIAGRRLACQAWTIANVPAYCYRFNTIPNGVEWPFGATHFAEVVFVFNNLEGLGYSQNPFEGKPESFRELSGFMSKSWVSFVVDLDPNGWVGRDEKVPAWPVYDMAAPENIVWDANVTSFLEVDEFREEGIRLFNENWADFLR